MLNCILSMVEKTKRALAILQHRGASSVENGAAGGGNSANEWLRRPAPTHANEARDIKRTAGEIMSQTIRVTEDRVAEVKRRAGNNIWQILLCSFLRALFIHILFVAFLINRLFFHIKFSTRSSNITSYSSFFLSLSLCSNSSLLSRLWATFKRVRKIAKKTMCFVVSALPSVCPMRQLGSHLMDFHDI